MLPSYLPFFPFSFCKSGEGKNDYSKGEKSKLSISKLSEFKDYRLDCKGTLHSNFFEWEDIKIENQRVGGRYENKRTENRVSRKPW